MLRFYRKLREDELGATAVEYGLIAGLISVAIIGSIMAVEDAMTNAFTYISTNIDQALQ